MASVWVAMSGGVDSSVAAMLLLEQGHDVTGVTMRLPPPAGMPAEDPVPAAASVCDALGISHVVLDATDEFRRDVVEPYADAYAHGRTPNPCAVCNARVKFGWLLDLAIQRGAELFATGHYARIVETDGVLHVARAVDPRKDQSYFLYALTPDVLERVVFPLGELEKSRIRELALKAHLPVAARPESQEACFVGAGGTHALVCSTHPEACRPGDIVDAAGEVLGRHTGISAYTIGQRKGLGIGGLAEPLFVVGIDPDSNRVIVGPESDLMAREVRAFDNGPAFADGLRVRAMVRYRMAPVPAVLTHAGAELMVRFEEPVRGVAPGQCVVCYDLNVVVAGGEIVCAS